MERVFLGFQRFDDGVELGVDCFQLFPHIRLSGWRPFEVPRWTSAAKTSRSRGVVSHKTVTAENGFAAVWFEGDLALVVTFLAGGRKHRFPIRTPVKTAATTESAGFSIAIRFFVHKSIRRSLPCNGVFSKGTAPKLVSSNLAPGGGFEPPTSSLTARRSAPELSRS